jgi:hypothetical protein
VADGKRPRGRAEGGSGRRVNYLLWNFGPPQFQIEFEKEQAKNEEKGNKTR